LRHADRENRPGQVSLLAIIPSVLGDRGKQKPGAIVGWIISNLDIEITAVAAAPNAEIINHVAGGNRD
jgi:hypothetical protein